MFSQLSIVNNALTEIGEATITSMSQNTRAARAASRIWEIEYAAALTRYRWNFARRRAVLAPDATAPAFGYTYRFLLPADCIAVIGTQNDLELNASYTSSRESHVVEGRYLLSDENPVNLYYIAKVDDLSTLNPDFVKVLSLQLAAALAYDLSTGVERVASIEGKLKEAVRQAKFSHAIQHTPERIEASSWVDSRHSLGGYGWRNDNAV